MKQRSSEPVEADRGAVQLGAIKNDLATVNSAEKLEKPGERIRGLLHMDG